MARPREFDEAAAVDSAMRVFWARGYEPTSTEDLCAATGLGRGSVYNAFGSKHELFGRALGSYMAKKNAGIEALAASDLPIRDKVATLFGWAVDPPADEPPGCLVVNTMVELAPGDAIVAATLADDYQRRWRIWREAFNAALAAGEIDASRQADELAHFVLATLTGLRVMARAGSRPDALQAVADTALRAL